MSAVWFVARNGESLGPYTSDALRQMAESGELQHTDLLWKDGMKDWRPAGDSKGLFPKPQTCANVAAAGGMDPQASSSAKKPPSVGAAVFGTVLFLAMLVLAGLGLRDRLTRRGIRRAQLVAAQRAGAQPRAAAAAATPPPTQTLTAEKPAGEPHDPILFIKANPPRAGGTLSPDFLPVREIRTHTFVETYRDPLEGEVLSLNHLTVSQNSDGTIGVSDRTLVPAVMAEWGPSTYRLCCEVRGNLVWYGIERHGKEDKHEPLLYIGAQPGDSWRLSGGEAVYTFEGLRTPTEAVVSRAKGEMKELITFKQGIGIVSRIADSAPKGSYPLYVMQRTE